MVEVPGRLTRWSLRPSEFKLDIFHRAGKDHHATDTLSCLEIKDDESTPLDNQASVLTVSLAFFAWEPQTATIDYELIGDPKSPFLFFIPDVCMKAGITDNGRAKIPTFAELITAQSFHADRCIAFMSIGKPNTTFNIDKD